MYKEDIEKSDEDEEKEYDEDREIQEMYWEDLREKANVARCYKSGKSRTRIGSKKYSKRELREMNGETTIYRLKEATTWSRFMSMPEDIQVKYIEGMMEDYGVNFSDMAKAFGINVSTMCKKAKALGIKRQSKSRDKKIEEFEKIFNMKDTEGNTSKSKDAKGVKELGEEQNKYCKVSSQETLFEGVDMNNIYSVISVIRGAMGDGKYNVKITMDRINE